jgi:Spy/CpxP family protein refolding chaperone
MEKNWKAALVFLCIFLAGGVAGAFVGLRIACYKSKSKPAPVAEGQQPPPHRPIDDWSKRKQKEFVARLDLTPEQQTKTEILFQDAQTELRKVREHSFQQTAEITDQLEAQIMDLLTAVQRPKFTQLIKEREERQKKAAAERAAAAARSENAPKPGEPPQSPAPSAKIPAPSAPAITPPQVAAPVEPPKSP